jgi:hypothetical protein
MHKVLFDIGQYTATRNDLDRLLNTNMWLNDSVSTFLHEKIGFDKYNFKMTHVQMKVINSYIRILKAQPTIKEREDGFAYLETTYNAT